MGALLPSAQRVEPPLPDEPAASSVPQEATVTSPKGEDGEALGASGFETGSGAPGGRGVAGPVDPDPGPGPDEPAGAVPPVLGQVAGSRKRRRARHRRRATAEWMVAIGLAVAFALVIKAWVAQAFVIPSPSMEPTLLVKDRVLVSKLSYHFGDIHRGDIVVFDNPQPRPGDPAQLIKRVVGLPGDTVAARNGKLVVNGQVRDEPYVQPGAQTKMDSCPLYRANEVVEVPAGKLFVMGDNREQSHDARCFGPVEERTVVGKAFLRIWPINRIGRL